MSFLKRGTLGFLICHMCTAPYRTIRLLFEFAVWILAQFFDITTIFFISNLRFVWKYVYVSVVGFRGIFVLNSDLMFSEIKWIYPFPTSKRWVTFILFFKTFYIYFQQKCTNAQQKINNYLQNSLKIVKLACFSLLLNDIRQFGKLED